MIINNCGIEKSLSKIQDQLTLLKEKDVTLHSLFTLAINMIFCGGSHHAIGGTTSAAIGIVWGNPEKSWQSCDYFEYFMHELTHTLMFLDELRFLHYKDQGIMYDKENFSLSAILQAERPFDRVLHSIVVATEVLMLRSRNLVEHSECQIHPSTPNLINSTLQSINKILAHPNRDKILTERSLSIIEVCHRNIAGCFV